MFFVGLFLGLFNISEDQGTIYVHQTLEHDSNSTFRLVIQARDTPVGLASSRKRRGALKFIKQSNSLLVKT